MDNDSREQKVPSGWTKGYSKSQKRYYYSHSETKHTQWHFPTASEVADPAKAKKRAEDNVRQEKERMRQRKEVAVSSSSSSGEKKSAEPQSSRANSTSSSLDLGDIIGSGQIIAKAAAKEPAKKKAKLGSTLNPNMSLADSTSVAIIVPYRDLHPAQNRAKHLSQFIPHMKNFLQQQVDFGSMSDYRIYIIEQSDDGRKFNRGKLLNIGFDLARKDKRAALDVFIFHDVDLLPDNSLGEWYSKFPKTPIHIARVWDRYSNNPKYFGGIVSFSGSDMKRINGYPNTFWGWGGEDDEMQKRCERLGIRWQHPPSNAGSITDLEDMNLQEKLNFLRSNKEWKCMVKWEALEEHEATWRTNGLADLRYKVLKTEILGNEEDVELAKAKKVTVDVMLNGVTGRMTSAALILWGSQCIR
mmetsp:Transcript_12238/g.25933  ORF Transcript_12238/g.25933 Transcript_12238/m.25933 type:complete len:413 (+) Transcript_12238:72-1310(+)